MLDRVNFRPMTLLPLVSALLPLRVWSYRSPHHLFVHCPTFQHLRNENPQSLVSDVTRTLSGADGLRSFRPHLSQLLLTFSKTTTVGLSVLLPSTLDCSHLFPTQPPPRFPLLLTRVANSCHITAIRLAAHI
jgi:hypothetical protein